MESPTTLRGLSDLEHALTAQQLTGNTHKQTTSMTDILERTDDMTAAEVAASALYAATASATRVKLAVLAANASGRARAVVHDDGSARSCAWVVAKVRETFGTSNGATCFICTTCLATGQTIRQGLVRLDLEHSLTSQWRVHKTI